jgi:hypothetical protein
LVDFFKSENWKNLVIVKTCTDGGIGVVVSKIAKCENWFVIHSNGSFPRED